jgi:hypothetical protein
MKLVIDRHWIFLEDNIEWMPQEWFSKKIFVHIFKKCIIISSEVSFDEYFPVFKQFGGVESSYIGSRSIKISLDNPNIELVDLTKEKVW